MSRKQITPASLARESGTDVDDILLMLWDAGIGYPTSAGSQIRPADVQRARAACNIVAVKDRMLVSFWRERLGLSPEEFHEWAHSRGLHIGPNSRKLPKGALSRIERITQMKPVTTEVKSSATLAEASPKTPLVWRPVGHSREAIHYLSAEQIEQIHFQIAEDFRGTPDPIAPVGVRSPGLLQSAAGRPATGLADALKYPTVEMAAAALAHSIIHNHPFYNGNKRTALVSLLSFLDENGLILVTSQEEVFKWTLRVASHKLTTAHLSGDRSDIEVLAMADWLVHHCRNSQGGERVVTFAQLRRQLQAHGCSVQLVGRHGGRAIVEREVEFEKRGVFGRRRFSAVRRYNLPYGGEGRQVARQRIKEIRRELHLSDEYGVDSASFYGADETPVDSFIAQYRKTLRRLARL